jgi:DNA-binding CsgD family transcriptional regulator
MATSPRRAASSSYHAESEEKVATPFGEPNHASPTLSKVAVGPRALSSDGVFPPRAATNAVAEPTDRAATPHDVLIALTYGLDLVRHGAILVALEGRPHLANRAALTILQKRDGISMARGEIVADRASDTYLLHKLLHEAITSPESGEPKDSPMTLRRETAQTPLVVRVVPGPELHSWPGSTGRTALLKLYDQDMGMMVDEGALSRIYGLTRGEAALATHLIQGRSLEEAAEKLFISLHTARTHLKRIFMKTDTHRQPEFLVRMLLTVL